MNAAEWDQIMQLYPALDSLSRPMRSAVQQDACRFTAHPGQLIFDIGCACSQFALVLHGSIRVYKPTPNGREISLYTVLPGEYCILTVGCLLGETTYIARGVAETALDGVIISDRLFRRMMTEAAPFRSAVFRFFSERALRLMELVEQVAWSPLDSRLAALLLYKGDAVRATHQDLANELGSVREVVSRLLKDFERRGLVRLGRSNVEVINRAGLQDLAGSS